MMTMQQLLASLRDEFGWPRMRPMVYPEEGTRQEFKAAVLSQVMVTLCHRCRKPFVISKRLNKFEHCPACTKQIDDEFSDTMKLVDPMLFQ